MASHSMFRKSLRFSLVFSRYGHPRLISSSGIPADCAVSYLVNSCGLSLKSATLVSQKVKLQSLEKPDSVLALLRHYEFSDAQIAEALRSRPLILLANAKKTLLPKLEFLSSIGISRLDLAKALSCHPRVLCSSLNNHIVPTYRFLKSFGVSDDGVVYILKNRTFVFKVNLSKSVIPNVDLLRKLGMPQPCIARLLQIDANLVVQKPKFFSQLVYQATEMGFDPQKWSFENALAALSMKETTGKRCQADYRRWGWSENHIMSAFRKDPLCMILSEKKLMGVMDFLVNKMGWQSPAVAEYPYVLRFSLEKRIIPRFSTVRVLVLKGVIEEEKLSLSNVISTNEEHFLDRFVNRYLSQVPQLLDVYRGKVDIQDV